MGLILPQTVKMKITSQNYKYYQSKGYIIPKRIGRDNKECIDMGNSIDVNVLDLTPNGKLQVQIKCDYCGETSYIKWSRVYNALHNLKTNKISCEKCKGLHSRLTHEQYLQQLKDLDIKVIPLENYIKSNVKIKHKCLICGYEWNEDPNSIVYNAKHNINYCPSCSGRKLIIGQTDLWTVLPDIAKLLLHSEDGYKYTRGSNVILDWKCPDCKNNN